jgi:hypothetical protein
MNHELNGEIAQFRVDEMITRAHQYRLAQPQDRRRRRVRLHEMQRFAFRRAVAAAGLAILLAMSFASMALAIPPDSGGGGSSRSMVKTSHSQGPVATDRLPVGGLLTALVAGGLAIVLVGVKRSARRA